MKFRIILFVLVLMLSLSIVALATTNKSRVDYVGSALWNDPRDAVVDGNYSYCVLSYGLVVLDISDPANPVEVSRVRLSGGRCITISGNLAYVGAEPGMIHVVDISDPFDPVELSSYIVHLGTPLDIVVESNVAYVAGGGRGLIMLDVSNPSALTTLSVYARPSYASGLTVRDGLAYVAGGSDGLYIFDISDPAFPEFVGKYETENGSRDVEVAGDYAYLANNSDGVLVLDISDPANPDWFDSFETPDRTWSIELHGGNAYVATSQSGLLVLDISVPGSASFLTQVGVDVSEGSARNVRLTGNMAVVAEFNGNIRFVDISNPTLLSKIGQYDSQGFVDNLFVTDGHAFVSFNGLQIIDLTDPAEPVIVGAYPGSDSVTQIAVDGSFAYLSSRTNGFEVLDISDLSNPTLIASLNETGFTTGLEIYNQHAIVWDQESGDFVIFDIADPYNPVVVGDFRVGSVLVDGDIRDFKIVDDYLYAVGHWPGGMHIIDLSDLSAVAVVGFVPSIYRPLGIDIVGNYAYSAEWAGGLAVYDISDPANPFEAGRNPHHLQYPGTSVHVAGNYAWLGSTHRGVYIINISDLTNLVTVGYYDTPGFTWDVFAVSDSVAYLADQDGLIVLDGEFTHCCGFWLEGFTGNTDCSNDGIRDLSDITRLIDFVYVSKSELCCDENGNVNGDTEGLVDLADITLLIDHTYITKAATSTCL